MCLSPFGTTSFSLAIEVDVDFLLMILVSIVFAFVEALVGSRVNRKPLLYVYCKIEIIGWIKMQCSFSGGRVGNLQNDECVLPLICYWKVFSRSGPIQSCTICLLFIANCLIGNFINGKNCYFCCCYVSLKGGMMML